MSSLSTFSFLFPDFGEWELLVLGLTLLLLDEGLSCIRILGRSFAPLIRILKSKDIKKKNNYENEEVVFHQSLLQMTHTIVLQFYIIHQIKLIDKKKSNWCLVFNTIAVV